MIKAI
jgi:hypothetical protein